MPKILRREGRIIRRGDKAARSGCLDQCCNPGDLLRLVNCCDPESFSAISYNYVAQLGYPEPKEGLTLLIAGDCWSYTGQRITRGAALLENLIIWDEIGVDAEPAPKGCELEPCPPCPEDCCWEGCECTRCVADPNDPPECISCPDFGRVVLLIVRYQKTMEERETCNPFGSGQNGPGKWNYNDSGVFIRRYYCTLIDNELVKTSQVVVDRLRGVEEVVGAGPGFDGVRPFDYNFLDPNYTPPAWNPFLLTSLPTGPFCENEVDNDGIGAFIPMATTSGANDWIQRGLWGAALDANVTPCGGTVSNADPDAGPVGFNMTLYDANCSGGVVSTASEWSNQFEPNCLRSFSNQLFTWRWVTVQSGCSTQGAAGVPPGLPGATFRPLGFLDERMRRL